MDYKNIERFFVRQQSSSDCGVACLSTVIKVFGGYARLEQLREFSGTAIGGTKMLGLTEAASRIGMNAEAFWVDGTVRLQELSTPAILHVVIGGKLSHYLVFFSWKDEKITCIDASKGVVIYTQKELEEIWVSKALLCCTATDSFVIQKEQLKSKREWLWNLVKEDLPILLISGFLGLLLTVFGLSVSIFSQKLIDEILPEKQWEKLILGLVLISVLLAARSLAAFLKATVLVRQSKEMNERLVGNFFHHLVDLPKRFFDFRKIGDITARMNDTRIIQRAISVLSGDLLVDTFLAIVPLIKIFTCSSDVGLLVLAFLPIYFWIIYSYNTPIQILQKQTMIMYSASESQFIDTISGIGTVKGLAMENEYATSNLNLYSRFQEAVYELGTVSNRLGLVSQSVGVGFMVSVLGFSSYLVFTEQMELGVMVALVGFIGMTVTAVMRLAMANLRIQEAKIAFDRIYEFVGIAKESENAKADLPELVDSFEILNLNFRFSGRKKLLQDISFMLERGKLTVLLGESGGGKSTLLQVMLRFYGMESGSILVNSAHHADTFDLNSWRKAVGYASQDAKIFNGLLLGNISMRSDYAIEEVRKSCEKYGLDEFFTGMPQGYLTLVGEEGLNLSGGQKQLVGLARVLLTNHKILLLDEFTGAMDRNTEQRMLDLILTIKETTPVLVVTHRIKPALLADEVLILENGRITSLGTPKDLLQGFNLLSTAYNDLIG